MYTRQEASKLRQEFWTSFGRYMAPVPSAEGETVNWQNYKTGEKYIYFRKDAGRKMALVAIECQHPDPEIRRIHFQQLLHFRSNFEAAAGTDWSWEEDAYGPESQPCSRVVIHLEDVSVFRQSDWPALISFFKEQMIGLDAFWAEAKYAFEALR